MLYGEDAPRLREEADTLFATAFADAPYMTDAVTFTYSGHALVVEAKPDHMRGTRLYAFSQLDKTFQAAGWDLRIHKAHQVHVYVPGWLPRL